MRMPLSSTTSGSRGWSLLVPTKILPPATTGLPEVIAPRAATHFTLVPAATSQSAGTPVSTETILRDSVPPHIGQSSPATTTADGRP